METIGIRTGPIRLPNAMSLAMAFAVVSVISVWWVDHASAKITDQQREVVDEVMGRLLSVTDQPEGYDVWPPEWKIIDNDDINAFAWLDPQKKPQHVPIVRIHRGLIEDLVEYDADQLAFILGHEIAHLTAGHVIETPGETELTFAVFGREHEIEADRLGIQLAVKAGFSYRGGLRAPERFREVGQEYTSFEGIGTDHPSWADRIALMQDDEVQAQIWRSMSAFETGVFLLDAEKYEAAELCFERVVKEFPKCYEGWANLGYARLMRYCDALEPEDLEAFDIGQLVIGGFYRRPLSLGAKIRGVDEGLWFEAMGSLKQALLLNDELILAKANLAVAYLVRPKSPDVGNAARLYEEVAQQLRENRSLDKLDPLNRAALLTNSWVGVFHDDEAEGAAILEEIDNYLRQAERLQRAQPTETSPIRQAINYTRAVSLAAGDQSSRREALRLFEEYLTATTNASSWWPLAYQRYVKTAEALGVTPKAKDDFGKKAQQEWRIITGITAVDGEPVLLSSPTREVLERLGTPDTTVPVVEDMRLKLYTYDDLGVTFLGAENIVAIIINGPEAQHITLQRKGLSTQTEELHVGMSQERLEELLGDGWERTSMSVVDSDVKHQVYEKVGLAVMFRDRIVTEFVVLVPPRLGDRKS